MSQSQNDEGRLHTAPASPTTWAEDITEVGRRDYPRCESCGARFPAPEYLERHQVRACVGPLGERRVVLKRLVANERAAFKRSLRAHGR